MSDSMSISTWRARRPAWGAPAVVEVVNLSPLPDPRIRDDGGLWLIWHRQLLGRHSTGPSPA